MTTEILIAYGILALAIFLFVSELVRPDITAIIIMVVLAWSGLIEVTEAFSGFSSNAVVSIMAVMIMGYGIDRSGIMNIVSEKITKAAGTSQKKILVFISGTVGIISSFMQNIGATALFLPALMKISKKTKISPSKLIMPMGFAAILGGTLTMVASGPLIILNDMVTGAGYERFSIFGPTPIGAALLVAGIGYFYLFGDKVLPKGGDDSKDGNQKKLIELFDLPDSVFEIKIEDNSPILGKTIEEIDLWNRYNIHIVAIQEGDSVTYAPWRKTKFTRDQTIAALGKKENIQRFTDECELKLHASLGKFSNIEEENFAGFAEIIIPPGSKLKDKSISEIAVRKNFNIEPVVMMNRQGEIVDYYKKPLKPGQVLIIYGRWSDIRKLKNMQDFIVVSPVPGERSGEQIKNSYFAIAALGIAILLVLLGFRLSLGFLTGALIMILAGVIPIDEIYKGIDWKTVFLLSGLIPLGIAFEQSGAAQYTADFVMKIIESWGTIPIMFAIGLLATLFSLFMSNVAATVLLVPLVIIMGENFGISPRALAILVAISASNSFILPTHQVNAFLMGPGGYSNKDYIKSGSIMTVLFLIVAVFGVYIIYT
ncbi:MAG: SLC13 family permease [Eubacteriales bacterium]